MDTYWYSVDCILHIYVNLSVYWICVPVISTSLSGELVLQCMRKCSCSEVHFELTVTFAMLVKLSVNLDTPRIEEHMYSTWWSV